MQLTSQYTQLTELERVQIESEIQADLVEHLYKSCPAGIVSAFFTGLVLTYFYFYPQPFTTLMSWVISFNALIGGAIVLYICYRKWPTSLSIQQWGLLLSGLLVLYAAFYGSCIFFISSDPFKQFISVGILMMIAAALGTSSVGMFKLGVISINLIVIPVAIWFACHPGNYYKAMAPFVFIYSGFLVGMNHRSTQWLINSLKLSKMLASFTHQANHDLLTDLPNQRSLIQLIDEAIVRSQKTQNNFGLICISINRLESFNSVGYQTSDLVVQALSKRLSTFLQALDQKTLGTLKHTLTMPRSDAFTIIVEPLNAESVTRTSDQLFAALDSPFSLGKREASITVSLGVALYPESGEEVRSLLSNAYTAMFSAKQRGGNQLQVYQSKSQDRAPMLLDLENDLHYAIDRKEFLVYYQPIIDLFSGKVSGMEALVRWNHPKRGLVSPMDFIPLAEETGMINAIGAWVLEEACQQTVRWREEGFPLKVAVNLSVRQLWNGNLPEIIDKILDKTGIQPQFLELELTETQILDPKLVPLIQAITSKDISLSIDDFGTGYSGLSYLKFFNVGKIKIDKSFVDDINSDNNSISIVTAILGMAKELSIKTLAEGVETKEQLDFLRARGCQFIQGFYFSKPLKATDFRAYLNQQLPV